LEKWKTGTEVIYLVQDTELWIKRLSQAATWLER
jgi:hypothetical protein